MKLNELTFDMADVFNELVVVANTSLIGRKAGPFLSILIVSLIITGCNWSKLIIALNFQQVPAI